MRNDDNPLLKVRFPVPFDRIRAEHVEPAIDGLLAEARSKIEAIADCEAAPTYATTLGALEEATEPVEYAIGVVGHLESVATTPEMRAAYEAAQPKVSAFFSEIPLHPGLWRAIQAFAGTDEAAALDPTRRRHLEKTLDEFRRHGAELDEEGKRRLTEIEVELGRLTTKFSQNVLDATAEWELVVDDPARLAGLPESAVAAARESARAKGRDGWRFTLQAPSYIAVMTYLDDAGIRERMWRAYNTRAAAGEKDNRPLVRRILQLRREKARLLGYDNFVDLVLADRMARDAARARGFVDALREKTRPHFERENERLERFRRDLEGDAAPPLRPWDVAYYAEKERRALLDLDEEALRPYFSADAVMRGLFEIAGRLFGIRIEPIEGRGAGAAERRAIHSPGARGDGQDPVSGCPLDDMPTWHPSVRCYGIHDAEGTLLGAFYADLFPRDTKRGGAWMNGLITGGRRPDGRRPHLGLICANVTPPVGERPALLLHREVETSFHEFGHLLHHCLSEVEVRGLAGTHVAWDFVELPSQIMQNWCWERAALDLFARHHETGEPIPEDLYQRMRRARTHRAGNAMMRQLGFATVDLALHLDFDPDGDDDVVEFARRILEAHSPTPLPDDYAMIAAFTHLFAHPVGYAGGYYSYKWAEVLDADAFSRFEEEGLFDPEVGRDFRDHILALGDARDPAELFRAFRGRDPRLEPLLQRYGIAA